MWFFTSSLFNFCWTPSGVRIKFCPPSLQFSTTMYSSRPCIFIFFLLFPSRSWVHAECYYPDKTIEPEYQPCNPKQVNGTACCALSTSVCSTEGYCYGSAGFLYRGGCTDPDWASPNCAKKCLNSTWSPYKKCPTDLILNINCVLVAQHSFSNILPCSSGVYTRIWCCSDVAGSAEATQSCCNNSFSYNLGLPYAPSPIVDDKTSITENS